MVSVEMTEDQAALLKPFADKIQSIREAMKTLDESQLRALIEASAAATDTNCWAGIYEAAKIVKGAAAMELSFRASAA